MNETNVWVLNVCVVCVHCVCRLQLLFTRWKLWCCIKLRVVELSWNRSHLENCIQWIDDYNARYNALRAFHVHWILLDLIAKKCTNSKCRPPFASQEERVLTFNAPHSMKIFSQIPGAYCVVKQLWKREKLNINYWLMLRLKTTQCFFSYLNYSNQRSISFEYFS